jgi:serine phosphatase RsbU (regulator of sigma subunit)
MTVQAESEISLDALAALGRAAASTASAETLGEALEAIAGGAGADLAVVRVVVGDALETTAVAGPASLAAELVGELVPASELPEARVDLIERAPPSALRVAQRAGAGSVLLLPVDGAVLELYGAGPFSLGDELLGELAAGLVGLALRAFSSTPPAPQALDLAGEALAAALHETEPAGEVVRLAAGVVGAPVALLWQQSEDDSLELVASHGLDPDGGLGDAAELAAVALAERGAIRAIASDGLPGGCGVSTTVSLGEPPVGFLQLLFAAGAEPGADELGRLATFGVRVAHVLRAGARARELELELERSRALLAVVGQATSELSLTHTLETAVARIAELLDVERVALYLRVGVDRLTPAAGHGLTGPHTRVAERLLELGTGPAHRRHALVEVENMGADARLGDVRDAAREADIDAALAVPLLVRDDVIGLLAAYPARGRTTSESEAALLAALASQLAVAVQNAQLHERTAELSAQRETALASEREAARRLGALYEISRSFAQSLSLDATLDALVRTVVDVIDVDAAVIRMPDERRELLEPRAVWVKDAGLAAAVHAVLWRSQPFGATTVQRLFREATPVRLRRRTANELLEPFLEKGWTGAMVPVATPVEVIASLGIFSFRPGSPITAETVESAIAIAGQAALAIDNARLYQQQKEFADTMQRSLLPRSRPTLAGLDVGEVYESSARVDVGGDIYDFVTLEDGRLAVVLGDVTGHGVDATADMAMAKFVFRSLAREHPEPADFLASANDVIVDEIATGKFITMAYLAIDGERGEVACASAGHPPPRILLSDGTVRGLESRGLALGIEQGQHYEEMRAELPPGATIVVYTDGVIEARRQRELYGIERLDGLLRTHRELGPRVLAAAVAEDARAFAGGELADDLAVVVIRRT